MVSGWPSDRILFRPERGSANLPQGCRRRRPGRATYDKVTDQQNFPTGWSRDGRYLLYTDYPTPAFVSDVWALPLHGKTRKAARGGPNSAE